MSTFLFRFCFAMLFTSFILSCGGEGNQGGPQADTTAVENNQAAQVADTGKVDEMIEFKFQYLTANIPSPMEIIEVLPKSGLAFRKDLLSESGREQSFQTTTKKAFNFGIYGVDLAYISSNEQFEMLNKYVSSTANLASSLDMKELFEQTVVKHLQGANRENKDTIKRVMDEAFYQMDSYLRSNQRALAATQMLMGAWIESQYITLNLLKGNPPNDGNKLLYEKVFEQKRHLASLVSLLKEYSTEKDFAPYVTRFNDLEKDFGAMKGADLSKPEYLEKIASKVKGIRDAMVQ